MLVYLFSCFTIAFPLRDKMERDTVVSKLALGTLLVLLSKILELFGS
jgi:hypothetical protein